MSIASDGYGLFSLNSCLSTQYHQDFFSKNELISFKFTCGFDTQLVVLLRPMSFLGCTTDTRGRDSVPRSIATQECVRICVQERNTCKRISNTLCTMILIYLYVLLEQTFFDVLTEWCSMNGMYDVIDAL